MTPQIPGPNQESVWDYPRPPLLEPTQRILEVVFANEVIARTGRALRVLETSHPPTYYFPTADVRIDLLRPADSGATLCEWKSQARYFDLVLGERRALRAAWSYPEPTPRSRALRDYLAFYAGRVDACYVDGEPVLPQEGGLYGGWITSHVVGPFKGGPGTRGW